MWQDPFTLVVALSKDKTAQGQLYLDDGVGYGYETGESVWRDFTFSAGTLRSTDMTAKTSTAVVPFDDQNRWAQAIEHVKVEQIVVLGLSSSPESVKVAGVDVQWIYEKGLVSSGMKEGMASRLTIKNPGVAIVSGWEVVIA